VWGSVGKLCYVAYGFSNCLGTTLPSMVLMTHLRSYSILHIIQMNKDEEGMIYESCMQTGSLKILHEHLPQLGSCTANAGFGT